MTNLLLGDCLEQMKQIPDNSIDAIVTDPPYGLGKEPDALAMLQDWLETGHHEVKGKGFMGKEWDAFVPQPLVWRECLRVLKPGGHLLAFAGTRTQDLMALGLRLAGFEIRDMVAWVYGSGFPKSLDVSKAIDKMAGAEREVVGKYCPPDGKERPNSVRTTGGVYGEHGGPYETPLTAPATEAVKQWDGWGTALKPALEPITLARKPLDGTVAANVLKWHTGGINVDGCRVEAPEAPDEPRICNNAGSRHVGILNGGKLSSVEPRTTSASNQGRWPANLIHDGSDEVVALFPDTWKSTGGRTVKRSGGGNVGSGKASEASWTNDDPGYGDSGSAARFFYAAKCSKSDRNEGCKNLEARKSGMSNGAQLHGEGYEKGQGIGLNRVVSRENFHPTVKPTSLMQYLCRLITPPGGTILDPFMGSGSTGKAAVKEGFSFVGIEMSPDYFTIAQARIQSAIEAKQAAQATPEPEAQLDFFSQQK
jgi:DNA modification methylase